MESGEEPEPIVIPVRNGSREEEAEIDAIENAVSFIVFEKYGFFFISVPPTSKPITV